MVSWQDLDPPEPLADLRWEEFRRGRQVDGPPPTAPVAAFVSQTALDAMRDHATSSPGAEVGGILCGQAYRLEGTACVVVDASTAIPALAADGTPVHLQFTAEAWDHVFAERSRAAADLEIVGWYHTHPGLGVFLSRTDRHTQAAFFGQEWNLAVVLDPHSGDIGAFFGPEGVATAFIPYAAIAPAPQTPSPLGPLSTALALGQPASVPAPALEPTRPALGARGIRPGSPLARMLLTAAGLFAAGVVILAIEGRGRTQA